MDAPHSGQAPHRPMQSAKRTLQCGRILTAERIRIPVIHGEVPVETEIIPLFIAEWVTGHPHEKLYALA